MLLQTQERHYVDQQLATQVFDKQFESAWNGSSIPVHSGHRADRIKKLEERKEQFDKQFDQQFSTSQHDLKELRAAIDGSQPLPQQ